MSSSSFPSCTPRRINKEPRTNQARFSEASIICAPPLTSCAASYRLLVPLRPRRGRRKRLLPARLQLLHQLLDRPVQLGVLAGVLVRRVVIDHDVRVDAIAFDDPLLPLGVVPAKLGAVEDAAVEEWQRAADADDALSAGWPAGRGGSPAKGARRYSSSSRVGRGELRSFVEALTLCFAGRNSVEQLRQRTSPTSSWATATRERQFGQTYQACFFAMPALPCPARP